MFRWQTLVGVAIGLLFGLAILVLAGRGNQPVSAVSGPILSECDGHIRELVIHYESSSKQIAADVYRDFLRQLEPDVTVHVVCPQLPAFKELSAYAAPVRCRLNPVVVNHAMTTWSRDRWVALTPGPENTVTTLVCPRGEAGGAVWPARIGDERIGFDLASALRPWIQTHRSDLFFDGGDFLADSQNVFVAPRMLQRNLQHTVQNREELERILAANLKCRVHMLDLAPDHHIAMFMVSIGEGRMLVGDPILVRNWLTPASPNDDSTSSNRFMGLPGGVDLSSDTQRLFDAVAEQSEAAGYRVIRLPVLPGNDGRTYLTYVNVLLDQQGSRRIVYLPFYRGAEALNSAARIIWKELGYEIRPVDCTSAFRHFGSLHCLVNVIRRD